MEDKKILNKISKDQNYENFDFEKYKKEVNKDDLNKMLNFKNKRLIWFIPIIGFIWFTADLEINMESIDRGLVRSEIVKVQWIFIPLGIIIGIISVFINIYPFYEINFIRKIVSKRLKDKINE